VGDPHLAAGCLVHEDADQVEAVLTTILRDNRFLIVGALNLRVGRASNVPKVASRDQSS
jgi:hypothetical protein